MNDEKLTSIKKWANEETLKTLQACEEGKIDKNQFAAELSSISALYLGTIYHLTTPYNPFFVTDI